MGPYRRSRFLVLMLGVASALALYPLGVSLPGSAPGGPLASEGGQDRLYVTAQDKLLVVDPTRLRIVKVVNVGGSMAGASATADGRLLYVANPPLQAVMVIDTATSQVIDRVRVGINPVGPVVLSPDEKSIWVVSEEAVSVIDAASHKLTASIPIDSGVSSGLAFAPSGGAWRAYVSNPKDNTVLAIDAEKYSVVARIPVGKGPWHGVVYSKLTGKVYVANTGSQDLSVIDVPTNQVAQTLPLPRPGLNSVAISKDGRFLFVDSRYTRASGDSLTVVDAEKESVVAAIDIRPSGTSAPANPSRLVFTPDGRLGVSIHKTSPHVTVIDVAALKVMKTIELKPLSEKVLFRCSVTLSPDGRTAYVTSAVEETITVIDLDTLRARAILMTHMPTCGMVYVQRR